MSDLEKKYPDPTHEEQFDFLIRCYFGEGNDLLRLCVHRAYLDLNRTLHGIAKRKDATTLRENGYNCVMSLLQSLAVEKKTSQKGFDTWHEQSCLQLQSLYRKQGFDKFSIGQAQKWLNMSLKYVFTVGEDRLPRFGRHYKYAHIPIDNVFLEAGKELGGCLLYTSPSPRDGLLSRMPSSA